MQLIVNEDWHNMSTSFYLKFYRGERAVIVGQKDGQLVEHELDPTKISPTEIMPLLKMPRKFTQRQIIGNRKAFRGHA